MNERERFEAWLRTIGMEPTYTLDGDYAGDAVRSRWEAWQAALKYAANIEDATLKQVFCIKGA